MTLDLNGHPHRRYNPLTGEWVLVSPHRARRPWFGHIEETASGLLPPYDPGCYLCPGNERAGGHRNPEYSSLFVFDNDFPALVPDTPPGELVRDALLQARAESGICRVLCFSPRHDLTLPRMDLHQIGRVVEEWVEQYLSLGALDSIQYVQIFENRGDMMGCSNPHPHCQVWASANLPNELVKENRSLQDYWNSRASCLICDYLQLERKEKTRLVLENEHFVAVVPFWAVWPFETLVGSHRHLGGLDELHPNELRSLAEILKRLTTRYDNLFRTSFPYSMGFHPKPTDQQDQPHWHFHAHFFPPLLRSATVRKFMVGYEMLATPQRDITAESAADRLRSLPDRHYLEEES